MSLGLRLSVGLVLVLLGLAFIVTTGTLIWEFWDANWFELAVFDAQLFVHFPIFGVIALIALYVPTCVAIDMYWHHIRNGKVIVIVAVSVCMVIAWVYAKSLEGGTDYTLWETNPDYLKADKGEPADCYPLGTGKGDRIIPRKPETKCDRLPLLEALRNLRTLSGERRGLTPFVRDCKPDKLVALPSELHELRYCFATDRLMNARDCCKRQTAFKEYVDVLGRDKKKASRTGYIYVLLNPARAFFLFFVLLLGFALARNGKMLDDHYPDKAWAVERSVLVAALAILVWPIMNQSYIKAHNALYGTDIGGSGFISIAPIFSLIIGGWALMIVFFFLRRFDKSVEAAGKLAGVIGSGVAVFQYDRIVDTSVLVAGSGATYYTLAMLAAIPVMIFYLASRSSVAAKSRSEGPATLKDIVDHAKNRIDKL